ncbi:chaperone protein ClpB3, mitochondrial-like [Apium graveolens]|uniref:chaperone protein ClpB3, mitochondrial-like n=1 Tax=Apium graveolens TaxID=4045 RepID=UPI003D7B955B
MNPTSASPAGSTMGYDDILSSQYKDSSNLITLQQVIGETSGPVIGPDLNAPLSNARNHKKEMKDDFVSVEHLLLVFLSDKRFSEQLFRNLQLSEQTLKDAVKAVRGK